MTTPQNSQADLDKTNNLTKKVDDPRYRTVHDADAPMPALNAAVKKQNESFSHKVGEQLERVGEKIKNAGADKLGNAIYKAGDKLEHSKDDKKSNQ